jgi:hypothetical protein
MQLKKNVKNQLVKLYNKSLAHKDYSLNFKKYLFTQYVLKTYKPEIFIFLE